MNLQVISKNLNKAVKDKKAELKKVRNQWVKLSDRTWCTGEHDETAEAVFQTKVDSLVKSLAVLEKIQSDVNECQIALSVAFFKLVK